MTDSSIGESELAVPDQIAEELRLRWQKLAIAPDGFAQYARERGANLPALSREIGADLYLAFACSRQLPGAIETFHQAFSGKLRAIGRRFEASEAFGDELAQRVSEKLFVSSAGRPPGITQYRGDAPLSAWVNTIARRIGFRLAKSAHPEKFLDEDMLASEISEVCDQELLLLREQYRDIVRAALLTALRAMPNRERHFLKMNLVAGLSMARIGKIYGISQSSVSRKIQRAIQNVIRSAKDEVRGRLRVSSNEIESIFKLIQSCIDLTLTQFDDPELRDGAIGMDASSTELPRIGA